MLIALKVALAIAAVVAATYGTLTLRSAARLRTQAATAADPHVSSRLENAAELDGHVGHGSLLVALVVAITAAAL